MYFTPKATLSLSWRRLGQIQWKRQSTSAVIGGIFQWTESENEDRVPFFGSIPVLRHLFRSRRLQQTNDELLLFLTPRIIKVKAY